MEGMREETLPCGTIVYTSKRHRFGTDAILLTNFCTVHPRFSCCDLGSGSGVLLLGLYDKGARGTLVGIEQDKEGAELLEMAAGANKIEGLRAVYGDIRHFTSGFGFDIVVSNPPYFTGGIKPNDSQRTLARHQGETTLADFCAAAGRLLKDKGRFCVCWPADQLAGLMYALQAQGLAPKRMQLVRRSHGEKPWLALVEARKACGEGLAILPDHILPPGQSATF